MQINWRKIEKSRYCEGYNGWKKEIGCKKYLLDRKTDHKTKEQSARLRCGNLRRERYKGYKDDKYRLCRKEIECQEDVWVCQKASQRMEEKWIREVEGKRLTLGGRIYKREIETVLQGEPLEELCNYARRFQEKTRENEKGKGR